MIAGDIDVAEARRLVEKWFNEIPKGPAVPAISAPPVALDSVKTKTMTDRGQLPRLYLAWHTPALYAPGDSAMDVVAGLLTGGKSARLYKGSSTRCRSQDVNAPSSRRRRQTS